MSLRWWKKTAGIQAKTSSHRSARGRGPAPAQLGLEPLEDRTVPSVYSTLASVLGNNNVTNLGTLEKNVEAAADKLAHIPFIDQVGQQLGDLLKNVDKNQNSDPVVVSKELVTALENALNNNNTDAAVKTAIAAIPGVKSVAVNSVNPGAGELLEIDLQIHAETQLSKQITLSLALPGLPIKLNSQNGQGGVNVGITADAELSFGLTTQNTFFWKGAQLANGDQLTLELNANLQGASLSATVGLLNATLKDNGTQFDVAFHVAPIANLNTVPVPTVSINKAQIALTAALSFDPTTPNNSWLPNQTVQLPSLTADINVDWNGSFTDPNALSVSFDNVGLDLGSALDSFIQPVVTVVQDILGPIEPILNLLTTPIPGLSDLSHLAGQGDITLLGVAGDVASGLVGPEIQPVITLVGDLLPIIQDITKFNGKEVTLGSFNLDGQQGQLMNGSVNYAALTDINSLADNLTSLAPKVIGQLPDIIGQLDPALDKQLVQAMNDLRALINPAGADFEFPILNDPLHSAFQLLLGQDADFFVFKAHFEIPAAGQTNLIPDLGLVGLPGVHLNFDDGLDIQGSFQLAYDTYGIREYFSDLFNPNNPQNKPQDLLDGFYIDNANTFLKFQGDLALVPSVELFPGLSVGGSGFLETGNGGSDPFTISLDGSDPKLRLNTLFQGNCVFDGQGELDAGVGINVSLGFSTPLGFVGVQHTFNIATATLENYPQKACLGSQGQENISLGSVQNGTLVLNLGGQDVTGYLTKYKQSTETFAVKDEGGTAGDENLAVTALGITQHFTGVRSILADGTAVNFNQDITIDGGVLDDATLTGGPDANKLTYLGAGTAHLNGGSTAGETSQLTGGSGNNFIQGGAGTDVLIGGACASGDNNTLTAGTGDGQLYAGSQSDDTLTGGSGNDVFYAGGGHDTMTGGTGTNAFNWGEGDGALDIVGGPSGANTLSAVGTTVGDQFTAGSDNNGGLLVQAPGAVIRASRIQVLSLDGIAGSSHYILNDLSQTTVKQVGLNLHDENDTDPSSDQVVVNAPTSNDNVEVSWDTQRAAQGDQVTQIFVSTQTGGASGGGVTESYQISTSISKPSDVLHVNTFGGNDTVRVDSTQPDISGDNPGGVVDLNTGAGDDTVTVGDPNTGLDNFFGRLNVDAGSGHNQITFDESASLVHDTVTLTATQVIRSTQTAPVTVNNPGSVVHTEVGHPFIITYQATGGDFAPLNGDPGVIFKTAHGSTNLYIPETGSVAPTEVICGGGLLNSHDDIIVGYDGQNKTGFPNTRLQSTLNFLRSPLTVQGTGFSPASALDVYDETAPAGEIYALSVAPTGFGVVQRPGLPPLLYRLAALTLHAGGQGNQIYVTGVPKFATSTVDTGNGNNTINVGEPPMAAPPVGHLDDIAGVLTINGGSGLNDLSINDQGNTTPQQYFLGANQLMRLGNQPVVVNLFHMSDLTFKASNNTFGTNTVLVSGTSPGTPATINPGEGGALLVVEDLDQFQSPVAFDWTTGTKVLTVNDSAAAAGDAYKINNTPAVTVIKRTNAANVTLNGLLTAVQLEPGLAHANTIAVNALGTGTALTVDAGKAADTVMITPVAENLSFIQGALQVHGNGSTQLIVDDQNAPGARSYQLTASELTLGANQLPFQFSSLGSVALNAGPGAKIEILATAKGSPVQVNLEGGANLVIVGSASDTLSPVQGAVTLTGGTATDALVLDDQNGSPMTSYTLTGSSITSVLSAPVTFQTLGLVKLNGSPGIGLYRVQGVGSVPVVINAQGIDNELLGPNQVNQWAVSGPNAGTLDSVVKFRGVQDLIAGNVNDAFSFASTGSLSGFLLGEAPADLATLAGFNQANATVQANVVVNVGQSVTLLARYDAGSNSAYGGELMSTANGYVPVIYRAVNGVKTVLATGPVIANPNGALAFTVNGSALTLSLNNSPLLSASDSVLTTGGVGVLFGTGVSVTDFTAE
jgi:hypothetical protein